MKVSFYFYSRLPLGRRLRSIVELCRSMHLLIPEKVLLTSRERRADLAIDEVIASAEASGSDSCEVRTTHGDISLAWVYGERRHVPRLWGTLKVKDDELSDLVRVLDELGVVSGTTYGVCDLESVRQESMRTAPDFHASDDSVSALHALYWYNYFGPEYREALTITEPTKGSVAELRDLEGGALRLLLAPAPKVATDPARVSAVTREWPFFRKYDRKAGFKRPVRIDYSDVWNLPPRALEVGPARALVGPPDAFIASVASHADRFRQWVRSKGLAEPSSEEDFITIFQAHGAIIRDELLVPAIAAYGELVRTKIGGVWKKAELLHRGEPVVAKPGRPWSARRVILEVLEGLEPIEV